MDLGDDRRRDPDGPPGRAASAAGWVWRRFRASAPQRWLRLRQGHPHWGRPFVQVIHLERPQSLSLDEDYQPMVGYFVSSIFARISELAAELVVPIFA
jgi:hypothetical protein